jgi:hypothetical protein
MILNTVKKSQLASYYDERIIYDTDLHDPDEKLKQSSVEC